jgi:gas vesicle protein
MNNTGKILTALVAGVAAGAILGVMLAPEKGTETRKKLKAKGKKLAGDLKEQFEKGKEKFSGFQEDIEQAIKEKMKEMA